MTHRETSSIELKSSGGISVRFQNPVTFLILSCRRPVDDGERLVGLTGDEADEELRLASSLLLSVRLSSRILSSASDELEMSSRRKISLLE